MIKIDKFGFLLSSILLLITSLNYLDLHYYILFIIYLLLAMLFLILYISSKNKDSKNINFKFRILKKRKEYLKLNNVDTKLVFQGIIDFYENKITTADRNVIGYAIDLAIVNINNYSKLGPIETLYENWGDNYYIDLKKSVLVEIKTNDDGDFEVTDNIFLIETEKLDNVAISIKEIISLCKENDFRIEIFSDDKKEEKTTIEITPFDTFKNTKNLKTYINSLEKTK